MSASRPEADTEYSRGDPASGDPAGGAGGRFSAPGGGSRGIGLAVLGGAVLGSLLLLIAEFTPLARIHSSAQGSPVVKTLMTGSHHAYALIPIALLAPALAVSFRQTGRRVALVAIGALGLVVLGIALLGDLPDAQASGLIGHAGAAYVSAAAHPSVGLYLETLGAVVLLLTSAAGLLLGAGGRADYHRTAISTPG
jgi:hypothetical protein